MIILPGCSEKYTFTLDLGLLIQFSLSKKTYIQVLKDFINNGAWDDWWIKQYLSQYHNPHL